MNTYQKIILIIGGAIIVLMLLFPHWSHEAGGKVIADGYGFLLDPPSYRPGMYASYDSSLDVSRLLLQWCAAGVATAVAFFVAKTKEGE